MVCYPFGGVKCRDTCRGPALVDPGLFKGGDGIGVLGENLFNYRYRERLETDSVVGNISGEKEAE